MNAMLVSPVLPKTPTPRTPSRLATHGHNYRPLLSSPLAPTGHSQLSSPIAKAQARRRSQYKTRSNGATRRVASDPAGRAAPVPFSLGAAHAQPAAESSRAAFFRDRFQAKVRAHEQRARERAERRYNSTASSDLSSDGFDVGMSVDDDDSDGGDDAENEEEKYFSDELLRRIMLDEKRKLAHSYARSYEIEVGSSFDPGMEDLSRWEEPSAGAAQGDYDYADDDFSPLEEDLDVPEPPPPIDSYSDEFDDDSSWADAYIASLPVDALAAAVPAAPGAEPQPQPMHANQAALRNGTQAPQQPVSSNMADVGAEDFIMG